MLSDVVVEYLRQRLYTVEQAILVKSKKEKSVSTLLTAFVFVVKVAGSMSFPVAFLTTNSIISCLSLTDSIIRGVRASLLRVRYESRAGSSPNCLCRFN